MSSGGAGAAVRAGAAYEAVLVDKVTGKVDRIIDALDRLQQAFRQVSQSTGPMTVAINATGNVMNQAARRVSAAEERFKQFSRTIRSVQMQINTFGQAVGQAGIHVGQAMLRMGRRAQLAGIAMGAFIATSISEADRHRQVLQSLQASWGDGAEAAIIWSGKYAKEMRRNTTDVLEGLLMLRGVIGGLSEAGMAATEIDELAKSLFSLGVDFAAFGAGMTDAEGVLKIIQALGGEGQELQRFGIMAKEQDVRDFAESMGVIWNQLSSAEKLYYRVLNLQDQMQRRGRIGAAARERFGFQATVKAMQAAFKTLQRTVGQDLEKFGVSVATIITDVLDKFSEIPNVGQKALGIFAALSGAGIGLTALGFGLVTAGILLLAVTSFAASLLALVPALMSFVGLVAASIPGAAIIALGSLLVALAAPLALAVIKGIQFRRILGDIGTTMSQLADTLGTTLRIGIYYGSKGEWDTVWEAMATGAELAFIEVAKSIGEILRGVIKQAFFDIGMLMHAGIDQAMRRDVTYGPAGAIPGFFEGIIGHLMGDSLPPGFGNLEGRANRLRGRLALLQQRMEREQAAAAQQEDLGIFDPNAPSTGQQQARPVGAATSTFGFARNFAANVGMFRPQISAQEKGNEIAQKQLVAQNQTNTILTNMSQNSSELVMQ